MRTRSKTHSANKQIKNPDTSEKSDKWDKQFHTTHPLFQTLLTSFKQLNTLDDSWPTLNNYRQLASEKKLCNANKKPISFVSQGQQCNNFNQQYEPRIYLSGEIQTRHNNWHDFFQVLVWNTFPKIKSQLNALHYYHSKTRYGIDPTNKRRSVAENFLTLFDECGCIVVSSEKSLLDHIKNFEWQSIFVQHGKDFNQKIECVIFGHAMYEKALSPYLGMTSHSLFIHVEPEYFSLSQQDKKSYIDETICDFLKQQDSLSSRDLNPLPVLGIPDWYQQQNQEFYNNEKYFRKSRFNQKKQRN